MSDTFQTRIPSLSDADLRQYLHRHPDYCAEAVEAALAELDRRGLELSGEARASIQNALHHREAALQAQLDRSFVARLAATPERRLARLRQLTTAILAAGLSTAALIYALAPPNRPNPLGYEPQDTKKYLRDLELYGGKVNILATEFMRGWDWLWQGRNLAYTVATLTVLLAALFWFFTHRQAAQLAFGKADEGSAPG